MDEKMQKRRHPTCPAVGNRTQERTQAQHEKENPGSKGLDEALSNRGRYDKQLLKEEGGRGEGVRLMGGRRQEERRG